MKKISFLDLCDKEVINMSDCRKLGYVTDVIIDVECGNIISFVVKKCSCMPFNKCESYIVPWENINKIGDDLICVNNCMQYNDFPKKKR